LGRLAFALMFTRDLFKRKKKKKPQSDAPAVTRSSESASDVAEPLADPDEEEARSEAKPVVVQPSELPPINTPDGELAGYNILIADDPPPVPKKRVRAEVADDEPPEPRPEPTPTPKPPPARKPAPSRHIDADRTWTEEDEDRTPYGVNAP